MKLLQITLLFLMLITAILAFGFPQFRTYILQTISLLTIFSIILHHYELRTQAKEQYMAKMHEEVALFLTTQVKPAIGEIKQDLEKNKRSEALEKTEELETRISQVIKHIP